MKLYVFLGLLLKFKHPADNKLTRDHGYTAVGE